MTTKATCSPMSTALSPIRSSARDEDHQHRPLASIGVIADLDRPAEDLTVEAIDLAVLAHEILGQSDVPTGKRGPALHHLRARLGTHPRQRPLHLLSHGRLVAGQGDQLGDVHALVAHALDVLDHVQQGGDQPQVARDRRLQRQQREDALVDLQVAPVDAVVVGDDHLGELDVLVLERLEHAVELLDDQVKAAQRVGFELVKLLLEVRATRLGSVLGALGSTVAPRRQRAGGASRTFR